MKNKSLWWRIKYAPFFIKLFNWEYWPASIANIPVVLIWFWYAARARRLFFFSAVNPAIETGGVLGESKINILNQIPKSYLPTTIFIKKHTPFKAILQRVTANKISYPMIAKPNVGERGLLVAKITSEAALKQYVTANHIDFIIQDFVDLPMELAVMHHRFPDQAEGKVTSICLKKTLSVLGNGSDSVRTLMEKNPRAILQIPRFEVMFPDLLDKIPPKGISIELEPIGNHSRGTTFLNGNQYITPKLEQIFNTIAAQMDDIYYGRFDMKCASPEAVENGDFRILEYNGVAAEPAHIYDPSYPLWKKYRDIYQHWGIIYKIYKVQKKKGVKSMTWSEAWKSYRDYNQYMKSVNPLSR